MLLMITKHDLFQPSRCYWSFMSDSSHFTNIWWLGSWLVLLRRHSHYWSSSIWSINFTGSCLPCIVELCLPKGNILVLFLNKHKGFACASESLNLTSDCLLKLLMKYLFNIVLSLIIPNQRLLVFFEHFIKIRLIVRVSFLHNHTNRLIAVDCTFFNRGVHSFWKRFFFLGFRCIHKWSWGTFVIFTIIFDELIYLFKLLDVLIGNVQIGIRYDWEK